MKKCFLVGVGTGSFSFLTLEAVKCVESSALVAGAKRVLECVGTDLINGEQFASFSSEEIAKEFERFAREKEKIGENAVCCAVFSGDSGFFSGAKSLEKILLADEWRVEIVPGISSVQYFAAKLFQSWEDWNLVSAHGTDCDIGMEIAFSKKTFFLTGGSVSAKTIAHFLCENRVRSKMFVGSRLSYADESITQFEIGEGDSFFVPEFEDDSLSVVLVERLGNVVLHAGSLPDEAFFRGSSKDAVIPMTKRVVRAAAVSFLAPCDGEVFWDIGSGSGAISVDLARSARICVHSVEKNEAAFLVSKENRARFCALNMTLHFGEAPKILALLPTPDAVFVGGSNGKLLEILDEAFSRNPSVRTVVSCITVETLAGCRSIADSRGLSFSAVQISVASSSVPKSANVTLMKAENPVWLVTLCAKK